MERGRLSWSPFLMRLSALREYDVGKEDNFRGSTQWGKGCQVAYCLLDTGDSKEPRFWEKPMGGLAAGVLCLGNYVVTNSVRESELCKLLAEKLCIVLMQHPAVRVTKLWKLICPWEGKNLFSRWLQNSVSTPAELWIEIKVSCFSWAGTDVALVLLCPVRAALSATRTFYSCTTRNSGTCQWLLNYWV